MSPIFLLIYLFLPFSYSLIEEPFDFSSINNVKYVYRDTNITEEYDLDPLLQSILDLNQCLISKTEAINMLKNQYGITETSPDENQRFILGKCNPILLINGIYASRIIVSINCKGFSQEHDLFIKSLLFCGDQICKDHSVTNEEHVIFPSIKSGPFTLVENEKNLHSACLGFFMQFYNRKEDCPTLSNGDPVCFYSPNVKITPYGASENTIYNSDCGLNAVDNVLSSGNFILDSVINQGPPKVFHEMISKFKKMGYSEGFSLGAVAQDYRRFTFKNYYGNEAFKYQIEQLYKNTGKKVIVIAHSYGTLLTLNNLISQDQNMIKNKVGKFIALAPPFAGASQLMEIFFKGMKNFNIDIHISNLHIFKVNYDTFGQNMMYKSMPAVAELRPLPIESIIMNSSEYEEFGDAINERMSLEQYCENKNCSETYVTSHSQKWKSIFGDIFPSLSDNECNLPSPKLKNSENEKEVYDSPCRTQMFLEGKCPSVYMNSSYKPNADVFEKLCGKRNSSLLYDEECTGNGQCLDDIYQYGPYAFDDKKKTNDLKERFNKYYEPLYAKTFKTSKFFDSKELGINKIKALIDFHTKNSNTSSLPIPPVDTIVLYSNFLPTQTAFVFDKDKTDDFDNDEKLKKGGDGTVPNWSSYLTGLKWLYDKKKKSLKQDITLVEFCSPLSHSEKYAYTEGTTKKFYAIGCDCLKSDKKYSKVKKCNHSYMLSDSKLISYLSSIVYNKNASTIKTIAKESAVKSYNKTTNYVKVCNKALRKIAESDK